LDKHFTPNFPRSDRRSGPLKWFRLDPRGSSGRSNPPEQAENILLQYRILGIDFNQRAAPKISTTPRR
jgi:hypothetical protein